MEEKKKQIRNVLSKCFSNKDEQFPPDLELDKITKIQFSSYTSDDVFTMSLFIASNAKNANNKPFTYNRKLSLDQIIVFKNLLNEVVTSDAQDTDLFLNTSHEEVAIQEVANPKVPVGTLSTMLQDISDTTTASNPCSCGPTEECYKCSDDI